MTTTQEASDSPEAYPSDRPGARPRPNADEIAGLVISQFDKLPRKRKPAVRDTGVHEWTPLTGIVAERDGHLRCLCLATGMKCLPASKVKQANGNGIHDWHAEILAMRAFNHVLLTECQVLAKDSNRDSWLIRRRTSEEQREDPTRCQPFALHRDIILHMYSSEAPCGDASMELTMSAQEDPTPWAIPTPSPAPTTTTTTTTSSPSPSPPTTPAPTNLNDSEHASLPGRQYFSQLGIVRRKPSRPDAPASLSKSCSDKLALRQLTSLLSSVTSLLVCPAGAYLSSMVLPTVSYVPAGFDRCFSARLAPLRDLARRGGGGAVGYEFRPVEAATTTLEFDFARETLKARGRALAACNVSAVWTSCGLEEGLVGGVVQGRKASDERAASGLSRRRMWGLALEVAEALQGDEEDQIDGSILQALRAGSYGALKGSEILAARRQVKEFAVTEALKGWVPNVGDESFALKKTIT